jgi:hypothetical protein
LLTSGGKEIKNKEKILQLLEAVWEPSQVAILHCRGHQRGMDNVSRGNLQADQATRKAAEELSSPEVPKQTTKLLLALELPPTSNYTKEKHWAKDEKRIKGKVGWWKLPDQRLFVPSVVAAPLVKQHELTHLGKTIGQILFHSQAPHPVCPSEC